MTTEEAPKCPRLPGPQYASEAHWADHYSEAYDMTAKEWSKALIGTAPPAAPIKRQRSISAEEEEAYTSTVRARLDDDHRTLIDWTMEALEDSDEEDQGLDLLHLFPPIDNYTGVIDLTEEFDALNAA